MAMTFKEISDILAKVKYKDWQLHAIKKADEVILCQWVFMATDNDNPADTTLYEQKCRKWFISIHSTKSEVIRTAYLAAIQAEMHEANESFTYDGVRLFDPHTDLIELSQFMKSASQDVREPLVGS